MSSDDLEARVRTSTSARQGLSKFCQPSATKDDLKAFPTREEVQTVIREEGERTRQLFNAVAERIEASVKAVSQML